MQLRLSDAAGASYDHRALMGKVINLNRFRKRKAKEERARRAEANRRLHGRTTQERAGEERAKRRLDAVVEGARLESAAEEPATTATDGDDGE